MISGDAWSCPHACASRADSHASFGRTSNRNPNVSAHLSTTRRQLNNCISVPDKSEPKSNLPSRAPCNACTAVRKVTNCEGISLRYMVSKMSWDVDVSDKS